MSIFSFTEKIRELVAQDELDEAIFQLSKVLSSNNYINELIIQKSKFTELSKQIRLGTISFEYADVQKNKIRAAILDIADIINADFGVNDRTQVEKWDTISAEKELYQIAEIVYEISKQIVIENQEVLGKLFTGKENHESTAMNMISLFHNQKNRGEFVRWEVYLKNVIQKSKVSENLKDSAEDLLASVAKLKSILYNFNNIDSIQISAFLRKRPEKIFKAYLIYLTQFPEPKGMEFASYYLENLRYILDEISRIVETIKLQIYS